jgi:spore cortex formation protein SpoVR/YcgB (stage V sporulation)
LSIHEEELLQKEREEFVRQHTNHLWERLSHDKVEFKKLKEELVGNGDENILYFLDILIS